jgi:hypothetical protein
MDSVKNMGLSQHDVPFYMQELGLGKVWPLLKPSCMFCAPRHFIGTYKAGNGLGVFPDLGRGGLGVVHGCNGTSRAYIMN